MYRAPWQGKGPNLAAKIGPDLPKSEGAGNSIAADKLY